MSRLLVVALGVLAASSCKLIGSKQPTGFACESNGTCAGGLTCCIDGFCRLSCSGAGGGTSGVGGASNGGGGGAGGAGAGGGGVECVANVPCSGNPGAPCHVGRTQCTGSTSTCADAEAAVDGTPCGSGNVCNSGSCALCMADSPCGTNVDPCVPGVLSCTDGGAICVDSAGTRDAGSTCGVDKVCTVDGACVACAQGAACAANPNPCVFGNTDCAAGVVSCFDTTTRKAAGQSCGQQRVCDGDGGCISCTQDAPCSSNPDACKAGKLDCSGGAPTCLDGAAKSAGAVCGMNKVCSPTGQCIDCTEAAACLTNPSLCKLGVVSCLGGVQSCVDTSASRSAGTPCGTNKVCDGSGACISCTAGASCSTNPNVCKQGLIACATGAPVCSDGTQNTTNGTACDAGQTCNSGICGTCSQGGPCTGNPTACKAGMQDCSGGTPTCADTTTNIGAGVSCGTNQVCNGAGSCVSCTAGAGCSGNPNACKQGVTSCASGGPVCVDGPDLAQGTLCSGGFCSGGGCVSCALGSSCSTNPNPCMTGVIARSGGACVCNDDQNRGIGQVTGCSGNTTCNGAGQCVACNGACQPANACQYGAISCATLACTETGPKPDMTACPNFSVCRAGSCCTGCWSTTSLACVSGTSKSACGMGGQDCVACPGVCKPGISGTSCFSQQCDTCL